MIAARNTKNRHRVTRNLVDFVTRYLEDFANNLKVQNRLNLVTLKQEEERENIRQGIRDKVYN